MKANSTSSQPAKPSEVYPEREEAPGTEVIPFSPKNRKSYPLKGVMDFISAKYPDLDQISVAFEKTTAPDGETKTTLKFKSKAVVTVTICGILYYLSDKV